MIRRVSSRRPTRRSSGRGGFWPYVAVAAVACLGTVLAARQALYQQELDRQITLPAPVVLTVPDGSGVDAIALQLEQAGLIKSHSAFARYVRAQGLAGGLQAGRFVVRGTVTIDSIAQQLQNARAEEFPVTILEGKSIRQIADALEANGKLAADDLYACLRTCDFSSFAWLPARGDNPDHYLEGYLWPDTYFFVRDGFTAEVLLRRLLQEYETRIVKAYSSEITANKRTLAQLANVASMVEQESHGSAEEKRMIADVIWRRLDLGMQLGIDATTRYELERWSGPLYTEDFRSSSPYNTRLQRGLPPTAIGTFGLASWQAALQPLANDYLYYLHDTTGQIRWGKTLQEHNANVQRYLR